MTRHRQKAARFFVTPLHPLSLSDAFRFYVTLCTEQIEKLS